MVIWVITFEIAELGVSYYLLGGGLDITCWAVDCRLSYIPLNLTKKIGLWTSSLDTSENLANYYYDTCYNDEIIILCRSVGGCDTTHMRISAVSK